MPNGSGNRIPTKWNPNKIPTYVEPLGNTKVTNPDGSNIGDSLPTAGNNGTLELGYNAAGQLVRIRKTINGTVYTKLITGDSITDTVVVTTKTFGIWS